MRHTQLLPRHYLSILNEVIGRSTRASRAAELARATESDVLDGVREAERYIVAGIFDAYEHRHPHIAEVLKSMKNRVQMTMSARDWHKAFNQAKIKARYGIYFDDFLQSAVDIGVLGIAGDRSERYQFAEFTYTALHDLVAVEDRDLLSVHPAFVTWLFDEHSVGRERSSRALPVFPKGAGSEWDR